MTRYYKTVLYASERQFERFNELVQLAKILHDTCDEGEKIYPGFINIIGDIWSVFYLRNPRLNPSMKENNDIQYEMLTHLMQTEEFVRWQSLTATDDLLSVLTAVSISEQLKNWLKENKELREAQRKQERAERSKQRAEQRLKDIQKTLSDASVTEQTKRQAQLQKEFTQKQLLAAQKEQQQAQTDVQKTMKKLSMEQFSAMLTKSKTDARTTKQAIIQIGTLDGKKLETVPMGEQFQLAEQMKQYDLLKKIAELTGRFKRIAKKKQKTKHRMTMERKNVTYGQEIARLLPMELASFVLPNAKLDFLKRYSEQQTLIFDTKGKDRRGRGPIIICMDESSSMTSIKAESKAFCLALLMIARKQKRDFAIVPFASEVGEVVIFAKGRSTAEDIMNFSTHFLGGGTNYEKPLRASLDILTKSEFNKADMLFVTDGSSFLSSRFLDEFNTIKKKRNFECTSIVLTNLIQTVNLDIVHRFSDKVIEVKDLFDAEEVFSMY